MSSPEINDIAERSVFPLDLSFGPNQSIQTQTFGITKRELFAAMALQGFCALGPVRLNEVDWAVKLADSLIEELRK